MRTLLLTLLLSAITTRVALANDAVGILISAEPSVEAEVTQQVDTWLRAHGHAPTKISLSAATLTTVRNCFAHADEQCARTALAKSVTAPTLVFAKVEVHPGSEGTRNIMLTAYWLGRGREAIADQRYCERCTPQLLHQFMDELMNAIASSGEHTTGHLTLTSDPTGATVLVDGNAVGATPLSYDLAPGNHQVTLTAPEREVETRQVTIRDGETTQLAVPLSPSNSAVTPPRPDTAHRSRALPLGLLAGGIAIAVTGGILIAIDEDASPEGSPTYRDTAPLGVTLAISGGAVALVGAFLFLRNGSSSQTSSGPVATITGSTSYFGWMGSF